MNLYFKSPDPLEKTAQRVGPLALAGSRAELRDGLNLGGGDYFKFQKGQAEILLVCNDAEHSEVFVESFAEYPYYFYVRRGGPQGELTRMSALLAQSGVECRLGEAE